MALAILFKLSSKVPGFGSTPKFWPLQPEVRAQLSLQFALVDALFELHKLTHEVEVRCNDGAFALHILEDVVQSHL